ncbi:MAG: alginate lyase family protein [Pyrinomonadaceae bacterium]
MSARTMPKPLDKIKKLRSLDEILTRGHQALSAYREQMLGGATLQSDEEFVSHIKTSSFGKTPIIAETLWHRFFKNGETAFFNSFTDRDRSLETFSKTFGETGIRHFVDAADLIVSGRMDILGLKGVYIGTDVDWHREPLSEKRSPLKHWKEFDDLDTAESGNKKVVWEINRHQYFFTLGVAFWVTGDERYAETFSRHLESWIEQNPTGIGINWTSSLEVAFRAMSWIWAFHFFKDSDAFSPDLFKSALKSLYNHGRHIEQYLSKYYSPNTHLTGEALGLYYLGTQLPFFDRAEKWRHLGEEIMFEEIEKQVYPDGVYFEQSTWYQRYTADFFAHFAVLKALSGQFDDKNPEVRKLLDRLETAFDFLMQITMPDGRTPLIGDDDGGRVLPLTTAESDDFRGTLALGATIFERGDQRRVAGRASEEIFWLLGPDGIDAYDKLGESEPEIESVNFPRGGYSLMRDGWEDTDNYMLVDCGEVGSLAGGHGHADTLSIVAATHGRALLVDSGTYTYHESPEMRDYFRSSVAHNTLVVDDTSSSQPGNTFGWKTRANATRKKWIANHRFDYFEGSHDGYERLASPVSHTRSVLFIKGDYWIMRDLAETHGSHEYSLNFHFAEGRDPVIDEDGIFVGDNSSRIFAFGDNGFWQQKQAFVSTNHGNKRPTSFMRYLSSGDGTQEFFTFIMPFAPRQIPPNVIEAASDKGRAFIIKYNGYTDVFVLNDSGDVIDNGVFASNFRYSWARLRDGESAPDELVLIDGDSLSVGGSEVLKIEKSSYASVRRYGSEYYIQTVHGRVKRNVLHCATSKKA